MRRHKISAHSVVLRAIGGIGSELKRDLPKGDPGWKQPMAGLKNIDWRKVNHEWESVCIVANSVISNRQARVATKAYLKQKLGLILNDMESVALGLPPKGATDQHIPSKEASERQAIAAAKAHFRMTSPGGSHFVEGKPPRYDDLFMFDEDQHVALKPHVTNERVLASIGSE
jgi:hypothetical protein